MKADIAPETPKMAATMISRARPATRERPVAKEKKAVLSAMRRPRAPGASASGGAAASEGSAAAGGSSSPPPRGPGSAGLEWGLSAGTSAL